MASASAGGAGAAAARLPAQLFRFLSLRRSPEVLPGPRWLAALAAALSLFFGALAAAGLDDETPAHRAVGVAVSACFLIVVPWLAVRWTARRERYPRVLFALGLSDLCTMLLLWPVLSLSAIDLTTPSWPLYASAIWAACAALWMIAIRTRIWMYAMGRSAFAAFPLVCALLGLETAAHHFIS